MKVQGFTGTKWVSLASGFTKQSDANGWLDHWMPARFKALYESFRVIS